MVSARRARLSILLLGALTAGALYLPFASRNLGDVAPRSPVDPVEYYSERLRAEPRLYPAHTQLALAYLERSRATHEPQWLAPARAAARRALALQDNFDSLVALMRIESYAHRFKRVLRWGRRAVVASVNGPHSPDPEVAALLVEAELGLGRLHQAAERLPREPTGFHASTARAQWLAAAGQIDAAAQAFVAAAEAAHVARRSDLEAWARTRAASVYIDSGRLEEAEAPLAEAEAIDAEAKIVRLHRAELHEERGAHALALAIYEALLAQDPDPALRVRAHCVARRLGARDAAARHFALAEAGLRKAVDAGEVFTLEALARLYLDAGVHLDRAENLAHENLRWKRDAPARALLAALSSTRKSLSPRTARPGRGCR